MAVEQHGPLPASNFEPGRGGSIINKIVLHTMVGWISAADSRFHNPTSEVSAHFGVRIDGTLWQWVNIWDTAFHAGNWDINLSSIGIEHEDGGAYNDPRSDDLYSRSAALVAQFCRQYNIPCERGSGGPGIYDHRSIKALFTGTSTACPDALDTDRIIRMANAILTPTTTPVPAPAAEVGVLLPPAPPLDTLHEWAALYAEEGPRAGIKPEIALAQALHETGHFTFTGISRPEWNNPAGLGVTGTPGIGNQFPSKRAGVIAHFQHLLMYFTPAHTAYCSPLVVVDQRHYSHRGYPNDVNQLDGHWAVPGVGYGSHILALVPEAKTLLGK